MHAWLDFLVRLSRAPVVSIASIRGRAGGAGSEFVLACDLRYASRENTLLGQFEGRNGCSSQRRSHDEALPPSRTRPCAGDPACGRRSRWAAGGALWVRQRVIADDRLDDEVNQIATRLARFDHDALARTKRSVDA
jgi:enoyl-CoA hydratase/carnithine racemase